MDKKEWGKKGRVRKNVYHVICGEFTLKEDEKKNNCILNTKLWKATYLNSMKF